MKSLIAVLVMSLLMPLAACGKKGPLMPPPGYGQKPQKPQQPEQPKTTVPEGK